MFAAALQGWGELVARTLADERCAVLLGDQGNAPAAGGGAASSEPRRSLKIQQTKDWLVSTAAHVRDFLESVLTATYRHHVWRVRRQVARLVFLLLRQCRQCVFDLHFRWGSIRCRSSCPDLSSPHLQEPCWLPFRRWLRSLWPSPTIAQSP